MENGLIQLFLKRKHLITYLLLLGISFLLTVQQYYFHRTFYVNSISDLNMVLVQKYDFFASFYSIHDNYEALIEENKELKQKIINFKATNADFVKLEDSATNFKYGNSKVVYNSVNKKHNFFIIDKGIKQGVHNDMGVVGDKGVLGVVFETTQNFSKVKSILNLNSRLNARIKNDDNLGTVVWNGESHQFVQLIEIPKYVDVKIGDTVETNGNSSIFPKEIPIGIIQSVEKDEGKDSHLLNVELFNDFSKLRAAYYIKNFYKNELDSLKIE